MDISRAQSPGPRLASSASGRPSGVTEAPDTRTLSAERDAGRRITETQRQVEDAKHAADIQLEAVRVDLQNQTELESVKSQSALENQRNKGYEALRELKRNQAQELEKTRRAGEAELARTKFHYSNEIEGTQTRKTRDLDELRRDSVQQIQYEKSLSDLGVKESQEQHRQQLERTRDLNREQIAQLTENTSKEYQRLHDSSSEATERATAHFQERFESTVTGQQQLIEDLNNRASSQIREVRQETSGKLAAYSSRQKDPFYKLLDLGVKVHDEGEAYVLTARIPEYEQKHVNVTLKGNDLVVSGYRRNEEKLELSPGRTKGTASFQSFHESFPLEHPVDGKQLVRTFDGDQLVVMVPKKRLVYEAKKIEAPARAKVEKPKFPENIPYTRGETQAPDGSPEAAVSSQSSRATRTLG